MEAGQINLSSFFLFEKKLDIREKTQDTGHRTQDSG